MKEQFESEAKKLREEAEVARKAKEAVLEEKNEMTKKHESQSLRSPRDHADTERNELS